MASNENRNSAAALRINSIGMIADMHDPGVRCQFSAEVKRKNNVLVDVTEPFGDESAAGANFSEKWSRPNEFGFDAGGAQALKHHRIETLHALLLIGRII